MKLRALDATNLCVVEKLMNDLLFEAEIGHLTPDHAYINMRDILRFIINRLLFPISHMPQVLFLQEVLAHLVFLYSLVNIHSIYLNYYHLAI